MKNKPLLLRPSGKDYLWGGRRLNDEFDKRIDLYPLAETWECSTHCDGHSYVISGEFDGKTLQQVLIEHPEFLGRWRNEEGQLPILIKFIDAQTKLSVQVHPDDEYAALNENGSLGKSEMWYVLDASKDANIIYGLNKDCDEQTIKAAIETDDIEKYLRKVPIKKDDVFFINAGTIHAIGAGALIAEIQESSNITYRMYDYNRTDKNGRKRDLHIDKALEVADLKSSIQPRQPMRVLKYRQGVASELLCRCKYFEVYRMIVNTERRQMVLYSSSDDGFKVLLCVNGCGTLYYEADESQESIIFYKGDCIFIPTGSVTLKIHGKAQFLDIHS